MAQDPLFQRPGCVVLRQVVLFQEHGSKFLRTKIYLKSLCQPRRETRCAGDCTGMDRQFQNSELEEIICKLVS